MMSEEELARLCSENNIDAERELYSRYAARLYSTCLRYCDNPEYARDLLHDAMIRIFGKISGFRYRGEGSLLAWMSRLTINLALNNLKIKHLKTVSLDISDVDNLPALGEEDVSCIPEDVMLGMISSLIDSRRVVFNMYCIDGYTHKQIASLLGISEKGSASILSKARAELKMMIVEYLKDLH